MAPFAQINTRIDAPTKKKAEAVLHKLGLSMTDGIKIFLRRVIMENGIPFEVKIPNDTTAQTLKKSRQGKGLHEVSNTKELMKALTS